MTPEELKAVVDAIREAQLLGPGDWRRPPPSDTGAEMRICAALINGACVPNGLLPDDFHVPLYAGIVAAALAIPLTYETTLDAVAACGMLNDLTVEHLHELAVIRFPSTHIDADARRVRDMARRRKAIDRLRVFEALVYEPHTTVADLSACLQSLDGALNG